LLSVGVLKIFWAEATIIATYFMKKYPSTTLDMKTLKEI